MRRAPPHFLSLFVAVLFFSPTSQGSESTRYIIDEGKGVRSVVSLGERIEQVYRHWGKPERAAKDDFPYATDIFYEYRQRGVLLTSDKNGKIKAMTFYCNTGNKEEFHETGLIWINPSSRFSTFAGTTSKGLVLRDELKPKDVFKTYGKPRLAYELGEVADVKVIAKKGMPFIYDMGRAGYEIVYPQLGISFSTFADMVENVSITAD